MPNSTLDSWGIRLRALVAVLIGIVIVISCICGISVVGTDVIDALNNHREATEQYERVLSRYEEKQRELRGQQQALFQAFPELMLPPVTSKHLIASIDAVLRRHSLLANRSGQVALDADIDAQKLEVRGSYAQMLEALSEFPIDPRARFFHSIEFESQPSSEIPNSVKMTIVIAVPKLLARDQ